MRENREGQGVTLIRQAPPAPSPQGGNMGARP